MSWTVVSSALFIQAKTYDLRSSETIRLVWRYITTSRESARMRSAVCWLPVVSRSQTLTLVRVFVLKLQTIGARKRVGDTEYGDVLRPGFPGRDHRAKISWQGIC